MKQIFTFFFCALMGSVLFAQDSVTVTFRVDMSGVDVSPNGVHIAGDFQEEAGFGGDWQAGATMLTDDSGDSIYSVTVRMITGTYQYKYINDNDWGNNEGVDGTQLTSDCSTDDGAGNINRDLEVTSDTLLPVYFYDSCEINETATSLRDKMISLGFRVAPNPMGASAVIRFDNPTGQSFDVKVMGLDGRVVREYNDVRGEELTIERGQMPAGLYFVNFVNEAGKRASTSLMVK